MRIVTWVMAIVLAAGGIAWAFYYTNESDAAQMGGPPQIAPMVVVEPVKRDDLEKIIHFSATVEPADSVTLLPKLSGHLKRFVVDLGDRVEQGDVVAEIYDDEFKQRERQAQANLEFANARLERAKINLSSAQRELKRTRDGRTGGLSTEQDLDAAESAVGTAQADVELAKAEITRAQAALEESGLDVANTIIRAPISGYVDKRRVDAGALVSPQTPLCTIVSIDPAKVIVNIPETSIQLARVNQKTHIEIGNVFTVVMEGEVTRVAPTVDLATRTVSVEITVPNDKNRLRPGMSADVSFVAGRASDALIVPEQALTRGLEETTVFKVVDEIAIRTPVEVGVVANSRAEIKSGLEEGDLIVVNGNFLVENSKPVRYPAILSEGDQ